MTQLISYSVFAVLPTPYGRQLWPKVELQSRSTVKCKISAAKTITILAQHSSSLVTSTTRLCDNKHKVGALCSLSSHAYEGYFVMLRAHLSNSKYGHISLIMRAREGYIERP